MIASILPLFDYRRRVSIKLSPKYEERRVREIRKARALFEGAQRA